MVLQDIVPNNANQPYDMKEVISGTIDEGSFFEGSCKMSSALPDMSDVEELELNEE